MKKNPIILNKICSTYYNRIFLFVILFLIIIQINTNAQGVQNNGNLYIASTGNTYIKTTFKNVATSGLTYVNDGALTLTGDFTNNQGGLANGNGTTTFSGVTQAINGTANSAFNNIIINNTSTVKAFKNFTVSGNWTNNGAFTHNSLLVTFNGSSGSQLIGGSNNTTFYDLTEDNSGAFLNFGTLTTTINHDLRVNNGTMDGGTSTIIFTGTPLPGSIGGGRNKNFYNFQINPGANITDLTPSDGNTTVADSFTNNGSFSQYYAHTISFNKSGATETISGTGTSVFGNLTIGGPVLSFATTVNSGSHNFTITGSSFQFNSKNSILNNTSGLVTFNATSNATAIKNAASVTGTSANFYDAAVSSGTDLTINNDNATVNNIFTISGAANSATIGTTTLTLNGTIMGAGVLAGTATGKLVIGGATGGSVGTLSFKAASQILNAITMNRSGGTGDGRAILGTALTTKNITLIKGVLATGNNLFTWDNTGILTAPNIPWVSSNAAYADSYIATCDAVGVPVTEIPTVPFTGNAGFRINNVSNTDTYFPVGATFLSDGPGYLPTPNRMMLNNKYMGVSGSTQTPEDFTVVVNKGDIGNTTGPRVNRIWYVKAGLDTASATMRLFFTERDPSQFLISQDEVETGFDWTDIRLVQKDYTTSSNFIDIASLSDIKQFLYGTYANKEVYGQYTIGVSPNYVGAINGITDYNRFSVVNKGGIILPVNIINLKAYQKGTNIEVDWTSLNEVNINHYEIEKSLSGTSFTTIDNKAPLKNGLPYVDYNFIDVHPVNGNNFYRIKVINMDGSISYTNIADVLIGAGKAAVSVFPNPVITQSFTLQMTNLPAGHYNMQIYNNLGQIVISKTIEHFGGSASQTINLPAGFAQGSYHFVFTNGNFKINKLLIVAQ